MPSISSRYSSLTLHLVFRTSSVSSLLLFTFFFVSCTQFIANAVEDMGIKRKQKEKDMLEDIFASTVMINKAKELIGEELFIVCICVHYVCILCVFCVYLFIFVCILCQIMCLW